MLLHDAVGDRQPETGSLAVLLRREERIEDALEALLVHALAVVDDLDLDHAFV